MTRDNSAPAWPIPPQPLTNPNTWRLDPNVRAKAIRRRDISTVAHVPTEIRTNGNVVAIAPEHSSRGGSSLGSPFVQPRVVTLAESCAKRALETLVEPFTYEQASRLPGWSHSRARHWIRKLKAKSELRATPQGHFKTEGWTR